MRLRTLIFALSLAASTALPALNQSGTSSLPATCHNAYTQAQEIQLGDKVVREVYKTQPVLPDSDPTAQYIRRLGAQLVVAAPMTPGLEVQWPFNFHVVASEEINAFALPGGTMFVDLGAIQAAQTEAQLAGVMAHEMSHVILRHSTCNLIKQQHKSILYGLGAVGSSIFLGSAGGGLVNAAQNLDFMHMSRGDEKQADMLGVHIVHDAGFDPRGLPQFFEIIVAKYGQGGAQFLSDHPNPGNRTEYLNAEIAALPPLTRPIVSTPAFTAAHATAGGLHALTAAELKDGGWKGSGLYASAPGVPPRAASPGSDTAAAGEAAIREADGAAVPATPVTPATPATPIAGRTATPAARNSGASGASGASENSGGVSPSMAAGLPPLTPAQLGLGSRLLRVQGPAYSISAPASWTRGNGSAAADLPLSEALSLAPLGAAGTFGLAYGVVLGVVRQGGGGVSDAVTLSGAAESFTSQLTRSHDVQPDGGGSPLQVGGQPAVARYLRGISPVGGQGATERDWLILVARPDGDADALLFVAPTAQFASMLPLFQNMLASFRPQ